MSIVGEFNMLTAVDETSIFGQTRSNYFFGNPCRYNPTVLESIGINVTKCEQIMNQSFTMGLSSYMRTGFKTAEAYI